MWQRTCQPSSPVRCVTFWMSNCHRSFRRRRRLLLHLLRRPLHRRRRWCRRLHHRRLHRRRHRRRLLDRRRWMSATRTSTRRWAAARSWAVEPASYSTMPAPAVKLAALTTRHSRDHVAASTARRGSTITTASIINRESAGSSATTCRGPTFICSLAALALGRRASPLRHRRAMACCPHRLARAATAAGAEHTRCRRQSFTRDQRTRASTTRSSPCARRSHPPRRALPST